MSIRFASLNSPALVAGVGAAVVLGLPALEAVAASSAASLALLKSANALSFLVNAISVSIPGRIDEAQDREMRQGALNPSKPTSETPLVSSSTPQVYSGTRARTIVAPSGWAFAIWGPIYLGEAAFVTAQALCSESSALASILPQVTVPFVAANVMQSLWCASFRPSYNEGWKKYVSVGMLAGTAYSLSFIQAVACSPAAAAVPWWYFLPLSMHFGWTTAATLVNLNGSVAMDESKSDETVIAVGHSSAIAAAALGIGVTLAQSAPAYGLTVAWALAACASGSERVSGSETSSDTLKRGAQVQKMLCWGASAACVATSLYEILA